MGNNIFVTEDVTGRPVHTDEIGGISYQVIKLADGTEDSVVRLRGPDGHLWVDPRVKRYVQDQPSAGLTNAAYAAGELLGTGWAFTGAARAAGLGGRIEGVTVTDLNDLITSIQLWFTSAAVTFGTDNNVPSINDTDVLKLQPGSDLSITLTDLGANKFGQAHSLNIPYVCDATSLFVYATTPLALGSGWAVATDLHVRLFGTLD